MSRPSNAFPENDPWASSNEAGVAKRTHAIKNAKHVPDAWDDDGDDAEEEEDVKERDNARLWQDANSKQPMPEVILTMTSTSSVAAPPPTVLQQPMRILKRPSASTSTTTSSVTSCSSSSAASLRDREAAYQAARERIFGGVGHEDGKEEKRERVEQVGHQVKAEDVLVQEFRDRLKAASLSRPSLRSGSGSSPVPPSQQSHTPQETVQVSISRHPRGPLPIPTSASTAPSANGSSSQENGNTSQRGFTKRRGDAAAGKARPDTSSSGGKA